MERILAIDTTGDIGSLALIADGTLLVERPLRSPEGFGQVLFDNIANLLAQSGWSLESLDCVATAGGPGSFTGVRIGLAAAKGLAEAARKKLIVVSNLQAIAFHGSGDMRAAVLDARRGEVYVGMYDSNLNLVEPEMVTPLSTWLDRLGSEPVEFVTPNFQEFQGSLARKNGQVTAAPRALAGAIGQIASLRLKRNELDNIVAAEANYVRRSDAELHWTAL